MIAQLTKSQLFTVYNKARRCPEFKGERVNLALGYLQSGELARHVQENNTMINSCNCGDATYNRQICKGRIGLMILFRALGKIEFDKVYQEMNPPYQDTGSVYMVARQESRGYRVHIFQFKSDAVSFAANNSGIHPTRAKGSRLYPDEIHP